MMMLERGNTAAGSAQLLKLQSRSVWWFGVVDSSVSKHNFSSVIIMKDWEANWHSSSWGMALYLDYVGSSDSKDYISYKK